MLRELTKPELINIVKTLDTRTQKFTDEDFDYILDMGYAELATIKSVFYNEEVVDLKPQYENSELKFTFDIVEDVVFMYDLYLARQKEDEGLHDFEKERSRNIIYKDPRYVGRVQVDLSNSKIVWEEVIAKYSFTPTSKTELIYVDQPTLLALRDAFGCALYNRLNDVERESQKRASLARTASAIIDARPTDHIIPNQPKEVEGRITNRQIFHGLRFR